LFRRSAKPRAAFHYRSSRPTPKSRGERSSACGTRSYDYLEVDYDLVWDVVSVELPALVTQLEQLVPPDPSGA